MRSLSILIILISLLTGTYGQSLGGLKGLILDPGEARVARAKIYVAGKSGRQRLIANDAGEYSVGLPEGTYKIRAEMEGFYPSKNKKVRIIIGQRITLNFTLLGIRNDSKHP